MKIVLIALGCLILLIVVVVLVGAMLPRQHVASRSAAFETSPERLFAFVDGPQTWRSGVAKYEVVTEQGHAKRWRETDRRGETITYEAVDRRPPSLLKTQIVTKNLPYSGTWTIALDGRDGTTVVRVTEEGEVYNPLFRFVSRFVIGHASSIESYLHDLGKAAGQNVRIEG